MTSDQDEWYNGFDPRQINDDTNGLPDFSLPVSLFINMQLYGPDLVQGQIL